MRNKVAVLYIVTGRYVCFWDEFYPSCEKYFLPDAQKKYFVFTDAEHLNFEENDNILKIHQEKLGWPYDTMLRFDIFLKQKEALKEYDYIFFFNANTKFLNYVREEILPNEENDWLITGSHPAFYNKHPDEFTYDRNPESHRPPSFRLAPNETEIRYCCSGICVRNRARDRLYRIRR